MSSPQTGPSSQSHQHSALFGRFFQSGPNFCLLLHVGAFLLHWSGALQVFVFCHFLACCILCGKPQFRATCRFVPSAGLDPPQTWPHCCNMETWPAALLGFNVRLRFGLGLSLRSRPSRDQGCIFVTGPPLQGPLISWSFTQV